MIRKARITDIPKIKALIDYYASKDSLLPRSFNELYEGLRDFYVYEKDRKLLACAALHIVWKDLAEIKSLAVQEPYRSQGIGTTLVKACIREAKDLKVKKIFVLTYEPKFFKKFGFKTVSKANLPHKIWTECINCVKFPNCQEISLIKTLKG